MNSTGLPVSASAKRGIRRSQRRPEPMIVLISLFYDRRLSVCAGLFAVLAFDGFCNPWRSLAARLGSHAVVKLGRDEQKLQATANR